MSELGLDNQTPIMGLNILNKLYNLIMIKITLKYTAMLTPNKTIFFTGTNILNPQIINASPKYLKINTRV